MILGRFGRVADGEDRDFNVFDVDGQVGVYTQKKCTATTITWGTPITTTDRQRSTDGTFTITLMTSGGDYFRANIATLLRSLSGLEYCTGQRGLTPDELEWMDDLWWQFTGYDDQYCRGVAKYIRYGKHML